MLSDSALTACDNIAWRYALAGFLTMKAKQTDKVGSFEVWREKNIQQYGDYIWPQINYDTTTSKTISVVFEQKNSMNTNIPVKITNDLRELNIKSFPLELQDFTSRLHALDTKLGLKLTDRPSISDNTSTYWDYRSATKPTNCLTTDIDALELTSTQGYVAVEAAQLFDTSDLNQSIRHIFKTFKWRKNQVNEKQYLAQSKLMDSLDGCAVILFHIIDDTTLNEQKECLLIRNDEDFYTMLCDIKKYNRDDISIFNNEYGPYLKARLEQFDNIHKAYQHIKHL